MRLIVKRCARKGGSIGLGAVFRLPVSVESVMDDDAPCVRRQCEFSVDLILWQIRLEFVSKPVRRYKVWGGSGV